MPLDLPMDKYPGVIREVTLGAGAAQGGTRTSVVTVGGEKVMPFLQFEGAVPHKPVVAVEIKDHRPDDWSALLMQAWGDAMHDPALFGPPMQARASEFSTVVVRMRLLRADGATFADSAQLFWRTSRLAESESSSVGFPVQGDGQWHECRVPVSQNPRWRGVITHLRLDPCNQPNVRVDLDSIRLAE